jgi:hypothetical protein
MMTTRERVIYVRSGGRADVEIFVVLPQIA